MGPGRNGEARREGAAWERVSTEWASLGQHSDAPPAPPAELCQAAPLHRTPPNSYRGDGISAGLEEPCIPR